MVTLFILFALILAYNLDQNYGLNENISKKARIISIGLLMVIASWVIIGFDVVSKNTHQLTELPKEKYTGLTIDTGSQSVYLVTPNDEHIKVEQSTTWVYTDNLDRPKVTLKITKEYTPGLWNPFKTHIEDVVSIEKVQVPKSETQSSQIDYDFIK